MAQSGAQSGDRLVSACAGVSLPASAVTNIVAPVITGVANPLEASVNSLLNVVGALPLVGPLLGLRPNLNVTGLLTSAAAGQPVTLQVLGSDGTIVGPSDQCVATSDSITLDEAAGIAIGGNRISGLGATGMTPSRAHHLDAIALGNNAQATNGAIASIALGANAQATAANSIALGAGSQALRGATGSYAALGLAGPQLSIGEVSVGAAGALRQITNVAAGSAASDAATVGQVAGVRDQVVALDAVAVRYAGAERDLIALYGTGGTRITNLASGSVAAGSSDAVNGSQLFATDQAIAANAAAVDGLDTRMTATSLALSDLDVRVVAQAHDIDALDAQVADNTDAIAGGNAALATLDAVALRYDGVARNTATLAGAQGTQITNLAAGALAAGSTDAVNGGQLFATNNAVDELTLRVSNGGVGPVRYADPGSPIVPNGGARTQHLALVGAGSGPVALHNLAAAEIADNSTGAVTGAQLFVTNAGLAANSASITLLDGRVSAHQAALATLDPRVAGNTAALTIHADRITSIGDALVALSNVAVQYDAGSHDRLILAGATGTVIANIRPGAVLGGSTEAVNGGQMFNLAGQVAGLFSPLSTFDPTSGSFAGGLLYNGRSFDDVQAVVNAIETSMSNLTVGGVAKDNPYFNTNSVGADSQALASDSTAIGPHAIAAAEGALAVGRGAEAWSHGSVAIGDGSVAESGKAVVIGYLNRAAGDGAVAIGDPNIAMGDGAVAMGRDNEATGTGALALGDTNIVAGDGSVGIGQRNRASGIGTIAIGSFNTVGGQNAIAIGDRHTVSGLHALALGYNNNAYGDEAMAIGSNVWTDGVYAMAVGNEARAIGLNTLAVGNGSSADGEKATALGTAAEAAAFATAVGERASAGIAAVALGAAAQANSFGAVALGIGSQVLVDGSVALGASALAARGAQVGYTAFGLAGAQTSAGEIAVARTLDDPGNPGSFPLGERQITGVAAGSVATDAVNLAQLRGATANLGTAMAMSLGGGASHNSTTGELTGPSYSLNGATFTDVGQALSALSAQVGSATSTGITYDGALRERATLAGAAGTVVSNLAAGSVTAGSTDAVNGSQLAATNAQVAANTVAIAALAAGAGNANAGPVRYADAATPTVSNGGVPSSDVTLVGASAGTPVGLHNVAAGSVAAGSTDAVNGGQLAAVAATAGNSLQYDRTEAGDRSDTVTLAGGTAGAPVTLANVADGAVDAGSTQAVNGRQLAATNVAVAAAAASAQSAAGAVRNAVQYDSAANVVTFTHPGDFPPSAPVTLRNVAAGVELTDAVNVGQLGNAMNLSVATSAAYTDMRLQEFAFDLDDLRRDAEAGTAAAMAMAQIPSIEGELTIGGGAGLWQGESAMALGLSHRTERRRINMAATYTSRGQAGAAVGVGFALR
ncbi:YadA-like family protein [Croceibacterium sp. TMG7-5b_MA50]|uniref:YadA-like family protein n=1 Tax=Croceibacterium sp. TMG7-5b_MA50 TaxID=3121290 RepID=UPI003221FE3E